MAKVRKKSVVPVESLNQPEQLATKTQQNSLVFQYLDSATMPPLFREAIESYLSHIESTEASAAKSLFRSIENGVFTAPELVLTIDPVWKPYLETFRKGSRYPGLSLVSGIIWYSELNEVSVENALHIFLDAVASWIERDPTRSQHLGVLWADQFEEAAKLRKQNRERSRRHRADQALKRIDISKFERSTIASGYAHVYANGTGWRARVPVADGWKFLSTRALPELAAQDRYAWLVKNAPWELLTPKAKEFYKQYKENNPSASHDEALKWSNEMMELIGDENKTVLD